MVNVLDVKNAINCLKHLFPCDITVWYNHSVLHSTRSTAPLEPADWPIITEACNKNCPIIIYSPRNHQLCVHCPELDQCALSLELFFPFSKDGQSVGNGDGVCLHVLPEAMNVINLLGINSWIELWKNYARYIDLLVQSIAKKNNEFLLTQQLNYLLDLTPEGVVLLNDQKKIMNRNDAAETLNLEEILQGSGNPKPLAHNLSNKTQISLTLPHNTGDLKIQGKSFFFNKKFIGALLHTQQYRPSDKANQQQQMQPVMPAIIGKNPALLKVIEIIKQVAKSDSTILLRGESGTGKERFAQDLHTLSPRSAGPFVAINCAAIPEHLLESELFGYEEGSFTGAKKGGKPGKMELANHGTLFLDEVGDMPLALQTKLLRVIQEMSIDRIGGTKSIPINIRLVTATNRNLEQMINLGSFREDLFFRLNVIPILIPPLRERLEDIELLLNHFLKKYCVLLRKNSKIFSYSAIQKLLNYPWPGNIRELENMVEYLVNIHDQDIITPDDLPIRFKQTTLERQKRTYSLGSDSAISGSQPLSKNKRMQNEITGMLNTCGWDTEGKKRAATELGISVATLYRRLKKYKIRE